MVALKNFNQELLSVAEQHQQQGAYTQCISTDSESEAKEHEIIQLKPTTASAEIANMSQQYGALLGNVVFDTGLGTINVRRGAAAQTPSIMSSQEGEANLLEGMVNQLLSVPDTPIVGSQKVLFREPLRKASTQ